jgi:hypothetical protein
MMNETTKSVLAVLGAGILLGILGDALLRATPWGLNVLLWLAALGIAAGVVMRRREIRLSPETRWLAPVALLFAAGFAWRDSTVLAALNGLGLLIVLALMALRGRTGRLAIAGFTEYTLGLMLAWLHALIGFLPLLARGLPWGTMASGRWAGPARAIGRGVAVALPLLAVFGSLFVAADAGFEGLVNRALHWDAEALARHFYAILLFTGIGGGFFGELLLVKDWAQPLRERPARPSLGIIEVGVALAMLNALFLAFVVQQVPYLFGGAAHVAVARGLTYAEYARRGFFELVTVATLVLPMLLLGHWLLPKKLRAEERIFSILAASIVAMLFVIMASAVQRMLLYQSIYGLTELRLYTTAFMGWLALIFLWFLATVVRGRRERFAFGALVAGFGVIAGLGALNPDALIVRTNIAHVTAGRQLDDGYLTALSADAVPELVRALPELDEGRRRAVSAALQHRWSQPGTHDWRTWNRSRSHARAAVQGMNGTADEHR